MNNLFNESGKITRWPKKQVDKKSVIEFLAEKAPEYDRKWKKPKLPIKNKLNKDMYKNLKILDVLKKI